MDPKERIVKITLDERTVIRRSPDVEHERRVAVFDLVDRNRFRPIGVDQGPYSLHLAMQEHRLALHVRAQDESPLTLVLLPLTPFRRLIRDYFTICDSYYQAIKTASPSRIETIDEGRRALHDEGSSRLQERLKDKVEIDFETARRLFTLICVLQIRG